MDTENSETDTGEKMRDKWIDRAWQSGPTTVAFFLILFGGYHKAEVLVDKIDEGYQRNAAALQEAAKTQSSTVERLLQQGRDDRRVLLDIIRGKTPSEVDLNSVLNHDSGLVDN